MKSHEVVDKIIKEGLKVEQSVKSIESLFENKRLSDKTDYQPYYQRNYVWDKQKATYFIESVFIGTEIPPLVFFNDGDSIEVIDGRQRYETIRKFIDLDFTLVKGGLDTLPFLNKKNFNDLNPEFREVFRTTKLRIIEFSIVNAESATDYDIDLLKKEIFRRYNSGITPLRKPEIEKAIYIHDDVTSSFKQCFKKDRDLYVDSLMLLFSKRDIDRIDDMYTIERVMSKIRQLLVITHIPIKRLSSTGRSLVGTFYALLMEQNSDAYVLIDGFKDSVNVLKKLRVFIKTEFLERSSPYLLFETVYWALEVLKVEGKFDAAVHSFPYEELAEYLMDGDDHFSSDNPMFYRTMNDRYRFVSEFFVKKYSCNYSIYIESSQNSVRADTNIEDRILPDIEKLNAVRINKPEPSSETIEDICKKITRNKFLIRPPYQRMEVINRKKSSGLIESILLGVKIPPIFIFKRKDSVSEVVDGQQRLLSIIGFIGEEFLNESDELVKSSKNLFPLTDLKVLSELNGMRYEDLDQKLKDKILDFNIPIVIIDQNINENFDPIDLFIRLNNKPYPIREDSFEMWNSYIDRGFISTIKENVKTHSGWFYLRSPERNYRMDNEQCYTQLVYLFYKKQNESEDQELIKFYKRSNSISSRMKDKSEITRILERITGDEAVQERVRRSIDDVEGFISLVQRIISVNVEMPGSELLKNKFGELMNLKSDRRTMQGFYLLWYILNDMPSKVRQNILLELKNGIQNIVSLTKNLSDDDDDSDFVEFKKAIAQLKVSVRS